MSKQTELKQRDILNTQSNVGNTHKPPYGQTGTDNNQFDQEKEPENKNTELLHRVKIQNAPFEVVGNEEIGYFIAFGKYKLTTNYNTIEEAQERIEKDQWTIIINLMIIIANQTELQKDQQ